MAPEQSVGQPETSCSQCSFQSAFKSSRTYHAAQQYASHIQKVLKHILNGSKEENSACTSCKSSWYLQRRSTKGWDQSPFAGGIALPAKGKEE